MVQAVMRAMRSDGAAAEEASLTHPPLTSCSAAQCLTGCGPLTVHGLGVRDPSSRVAVRNCFAESESPGGFIKTDC